MKQDDRSSHGASHHWTGPMKVARHGPQNGYGSKIKPLGTTGFSLFFLSPLGFFSKCFRYPVFLTHNQIKTGFPDVLRSHPVFALAQVPAERQPPWPRQCALRRCFWLPLNFSLGPSSRKRRCEHNRKKQRYISHHFWMGATAWLAWLLEVLLSLLSLFWRSSESFLHPKVSDICLPAQCLLEKKPFRAVFGSGRLSRPERALRPAVVAGGVDCVIEIGWGRVFAVFTIESLWDIDTNISDYWVHVE